MLPLKQAWALFSCCDDCLTLVMLPLKQAWVLLLKLHEYLADVCYKLVIFKILPDSLNESTNEFNQRLHNFLFVSKLQVHVE